MWVEKYRPSKLDNLMNQDEIKLFISGAIKNKNIPHLLLYGPPGTGKTTIINILCKTLFTYSKTEIPNTFELFEENNKLRVNRILNLNASDERGIKIVREKIKYFASLAISQSYNNKIPNFKVIILDEADSMSCEAQYALRRIIEKYSTSTRFILICNYITKIIPQIVSRCFKFKFLPVTYDASKVIINNILEKEGLFNQLNNEIYEYIYNCTSGDMRKTVMLLQKISYVYSNISLKEITLEHIKRIFNELPEDIFNSLIDILKNKLTIDNQKKIFKYVTFCISKAYNINRIINNLFMYFLKDNSINTTHKYKIINLLSMIDNKLNGGGIEFIHLCDLLITLNCLLNNVSYDITTNPYTIKYSITK